MAPRKRESNPSDHERLVFEAKNLFSELDAQFESDNFDALGYHARVTLPIQPHTPFARSEGVRSRFSETFGKEVASNLPWTIELGYIPQTEALDITLVEIPLKSADQMERLILQRLNSDRFVVLHSDSQHEAEPYSLPLEALEQQFIDESEQRSFTSDVSLAGVKQFLATIGYAMPELFTTPEDIRLHIVNTLEEARSWQVKESVVIPCTEQMQLTINRMISEHPGSRQQIENDTVLEAVLEHIDPTADNRKQFVITYEVIDYTVKKPTAVIRELRLETSDRDVAEKGNASYRVVRSSTVPITIEFLKQLSEAIWEATGPGL